jgi:hypothetical protein
LAQLRAAIPAATTGHLAAIDLSGLLQMVGTTEKLALPQFRYDPRPRPTPEATGAAVAAQPRIFGSWINVVDLQVF